MRKMIIKKKKKSELKKLNIPKAIPHKLCFLGQEELSS
jgi:hypothetical protein